MCKQRQYSLRRHVWRVVALVALIPILFVTLALPFDHVVRWRMQIQVEATANVCRRALEVGAADPFARCVGAAEANQTWVRVYRDGVAVLDHDAGSDSTAGWLERLLEPKTRSWLRAHDPLVEFDQPGEETPSHCHVTEGDRFLVCDSMTLTNTRAPQVVHVSAGDVRSVRALSSDGVVKLAAQVLLVALLIGWWLGVRLVRPIEALRDNVLSRRGEREVPPVPDDDPTEVGELATAFNELLGDLDERRRMNEQFTEDLAHDLKNPIATVLACAENMEAARELGPAELERYSKCLRRSGERLNTIVGEFLELARAEAGLEHSPRAPLRVDTLLAAIAERVRVTPDHDVTVTVTGTPVVALASDVHLDRALTNIVENAATFGEHVEVDLAEEGGDVVIRITDDGPGIAEDDLPHVFDRFFTRRNDGTGLGLALARAIVDAHHGVIDVESQEGAGTTFIVRLPSYESHTRMTDG